MKKEFHLNQKTFITLYAIFSILGAVAALFLWFEYRFIGRGIVGFAILYLFFKDDPFRYQHGSISELLLHPNKTKDFIAQFIWTLILVLGGLQILEVYLYFLAYFKK